LDAASDAGEARRFNLIAHSQAGLDARYLVSSLGYGGQIASVTTIATPHRGTVVADAAAGLLEGLPLDGWLVEQAASTLTGLLGAGPAQAVGAIEGLTTTHAALFNQANPDDPRVAYASWSGRTCGVLEPGCQLAHAGEIVHPLLGPTYTLISLLEGPNDGMVGMRSSMWGQHLGSVPADHFDQIGQIAGSTSYDHIGFFLGEADRLATTGY
jgi:triacylglycerol lipase